MMVRYEDFGWLSIETYTKWNIENESRIDSDGLIESYIRDETSTASK